MNCEICNTSFSSKSNLTNHQKTAKFCLKLQSKTNTDYTCMKCKKILANKSYYDKHIIKCEAKVEEEIITIKNEKEKEILLITKNYNDKISSLMTQNEKEKLKLKTELQKKIDMYVETVERNENSIKELKYRERELKEMQKLKEETYKNQLQKYENNIKELQNKLERLAAGNYGFISDSESESEEENVEEPILENKRKLVLNEISVISRKEDNYINATQLCKAGGKRFNNWIRMETTQELIKELEEEMKKSNATKLALENQAQTDTAKGSALNSADPFGKEKSLVEIISTGSNSSRGSWIHPDLGIQLAQWISPKFSIQVSRWVRQLCTVGKVEIDLKTLKENQKRIKLLENKCLARQRRVEYKEKNVIYILTTKNNKKDGIYTFGKAKDFMNRLSSYNKSEEHEVVFIKECQNEKHMDVMENLIFYKLDKYREQANRERFIVPKDKDVEFFIDVVDETIKVNK